LRLFKECEPGSDFPYIYPASAVAKVEPHEGTLRHGYFEQKVSNCLFVHSENPNDWLPFSGAGYSDCLGAFAITKTDYKLSNVCPPIYLSAPSNAIHIKYIPVYIQEDATLHSLFISGNCSTCFGCYLHPSSGAHTTVSTASGICHTVTATCRYRGRVGTGLSVLWVAYVTHSTLKPVPTLPQ